MIVAFKGIYAMKYAMVLKFNYCLVMILWTSMIAFLWAIMIAIYRLEMNINGDLMADIWR